MNELKEKYFFLVDFFLPESENLFLKKILIVRENHYLNYLNYFIYPIQYKGFFNASFFILLLREDFLFQDKASFLNTVEDSLYHGLKNIYLLNFKKLQININHYVDEVNFNSNYLLLQYELNTQQNNFSFHIIVTWDFLNCFINGLVNEKNIDTRNDISELLAYLKLRLYRDSITSFWDLRNFVRELSDKDIQLLLNQLLKNNIVEETMLTGFIAGFHNKETVARLLKNLSRNLQDDVQKNLSFIMTDKRWVEESYYLIRSGIETLVFNNQLQISQLNYIQKIKDRIKKERYFKIFKDKSFQDYLLDFFKKDLIEKIKLKVERKLILISLKGCNEASVNFFLENLSRNAREEFLNDLSFYANQSTEEEVFKVRIKIIEEVKSLIYEKEAEDIAVFKNIIMNLSRLNLKLFIEEAGIIKFVQATVKEGKELKRHILNSIKGVMKCLFTDLYSGKVRFKQNFGEQTINKTKKEILKTYYFLKDNGKFIGDWGRCVTL